MLFKGTRYTLRDYQEEAVVEGIKAMKSGVRGIILLPTGSGKSLVIANIANQLEGKTIIFQPSKEILQQNYHKYLAYSDDMNTSIYSASAGEKNLSKVVFATIGSVLNNIHKFQDYKNIIIDECHLVNPKGGMYKKMLEYIEDCNVLGLTATPYRLHSTSFGTDLRFITRTRPKIFKKVLYYSQISDLKDRGYLCDLEYYKIDGFDSTKLRDNSTGADYTDQSVQNLYKSMGFDGKLVDTVKRLIKSGRKNILVFTRFIHESEHLVRELGTIARVVSSHTHKKERKTIIDGFKTGEIQVVANVGVLTTGFDYPELECVVLARPTKSLALYYQMVGRGIRPSDQKDSCRVIDMCENVNRFGKVEDLKVCNDGGEKRVIKTGKRDLTNVYIDNKQHFNSPNTKFNGG